MLAHKIQIDKSGSPDVMQYRTSTLSNLAPNEVLVKQNIIGFNYLDLSQRAGHMYTLDLPSGLGHEAAGIVEAVGSFVLDLKVGDRVVYMNAPIGAYADYRNLPADRMIKIPDEITNMQAATLLFKGLTAQYLVNRTYKVSTNDLVLVHAAAGGVGQILCNWSKARGAVVVGTVTSESKFQTAYAAGCDIVINQSNHNWPDELLKATQGRKANVVYDSIGKDTFLKSLDYTAQFGTVVIYGAISGPAPQIDPELLNQKGCSSSQLDPDNA